MRTDVELLAPAGSYDSMIAAYAAGADAVYIGGNRFGARAYADNLDEEQLKRAICYAHEKNRKLYLTVNTLLKEDELEQLYAYLNPLYREGLDAVIVQDLGVFHFVRDVFPEMSIHASTQMGITGAAGAKLLKEMGASRVVTARELSLEEIRKIHEQTDIEIESFVHGALCFCYSGQCLLSSMIGGRSGNRGRCAQPCRLPYDLIDEKGQRQAGKYLLSPKDICTLDMLPELLECGIYSMKIEGRMKRPEYTAGVVRVYRQCLERLFERGADGYAPTEQEKKELMDLYNRGGFSTGYYRQQNGRDMMASERPNHWGLKAARAVQVKGAKVAFRALEPLHVGDVLEYREGEDAREVTMKENVAKGGTFLLPVRVKKDKELYRMRNESLLRDLNRTYLFEEHPEKINGKLILSKRKPAILCIEYGEYRVCVQGKEAQQAVNRPLQAADIERQMRKTGGSGFVFEHLDVTMEDDLFLPIQALNELRRDAIDALKATIRESNSRPDGKRRKIAYQEFAGKETSCAVNVSLEDRTALAALCRIEELQTIYIDCNAYADAREMIGESEAVVARCHAAGKQCMYIMPWIFRKEANAYYEREDVWNALNRYDGVLVRSLDAYAFLKERGYGKKMAADWNLYTLNREARAAMDELGLAYDTVSPELNRKEMQRRGCGRSEVLVYGYQPLMVSAQCQQKNTGGCTHRPQTTFLIDRKRKRFAVKNHCAFCYNTIYNGTPLELLGSVEAVEACRPYAIRLAFTTEDPETIVAVTESYVDGFVRKKKVDRVITEFTRGHFERGVE